MRSLSRVMVGVMLSSIWNVSPATHTHTPVWFILVRYAISCGRLATLLHAKLRIRAFCCSWFRQRRIAFPRYTCVTRKAKIKPSHAGNTGCVQPCSSVSTSLVDNKTGGVRVKATSRRVLANIVAVEKQCVPYSECISVALVIQQARLLYCHLWPHICNIFFPHYLINGTVFGKIVTEHKMCVLIFSTTFVWNARHSKNNRYPLDMSVGGPPETF